jgi:hypothetical protein
MAALALGAIRTAQADEAGDSALPAAGFSGDRYASLWTKSPFAIATPEAAAGSTDYALVGLAQFDGISYASLIDKQSQEHFVLASDKPVRNLTLVSISRQPSGATAVIRRNGEVLSLKLENVAPPTNGGPPQNPQGFPMAMPNGNGMINQPVFRPPVRFHRPLIRVPPPPQ